MKLKIKIRDEIYETLQKADHISFDKIYEIFEAIRNGVPSDEALDNVKKDKADEGLGNVKADKTASTKDADDHAEVCRLMTVYLGRKFEPHEADIICLYETIRQNKEMLSKLDGAEKIFVKMFIRSLVS